MEEKARLDGNTSQRITRTMLKRGIRLERGICRVNLCLNGGACVSERVWYFFDCRANLWY